MADGENYRLEIFFFSVKRSKGGRQNHSSQGFVQSTLQIKSLCWYAYRITQSFMVFLAFCQQERVCASKNPLARDQTAANHWLFADSEVDVSQIRGVSLVRCAEIYRTGIIMKITNKQTQLNWIGPMHKEHVVYKASERSEGQVILWWSVWSCDAHLDVCSAFCMHVRVDVDVCECRRTLSPFLFSPPQCCPHSWVFGTWQMSLAGKLSSDHRVCIVARTGSFQTSATVVCSKREQGRRTVRCVHNCSRQIWDGEKRECS